MTTTKGWAKEVRGGMEDAKARAAMVTGWTVQVKGGIRNEVIAGKAAPATYGGKGDVFNN